MRLPEIYGFYIFAILVENFASMRARKTLGERKKIA